jgi:DNA mismatch endonuclease (patch repair protein)
MPLRRALHGRGLRFFVDRAPLTDYPRRRADIVFPRLRLAVFVDGCFWHGCPQHATAPKTNSEWWRAKLEANRRRDRETDVALQAAGWKVVRVWEHEGADGAAEHVAAIVARLRSGSAGTRDLDT